MSDSASSFLQVRFRNRLVGWLNDFDAEKAPDLINILNVIPTFSEEDGPCEDAIENRVFKVGKFSLNFFKKMEISAAGYAAYLTKHVPPYAQIYSEPSRDCTIYRWRAVNIEEYDDYEWIFDYGCFIPIDTVPDEELLTKPADEGVGLSGWTDVSADMWKTVYEKVYEKEANKERTKRILDEAVRGSTSAPFINELNRYDYTSTTMPTASYKPVSFTVGYDDVLNWDSSS